MITARPHARAYAVDGAGEHPLEPRVLERPDARTATIPAVAELRSLRAARAGGLRD